MLGPRIAALRHTRNMSQAELAQQLKISPSAVGMYEQGRREPALNLLVQMAEIFGVTTDYLLTGKQEEGAITKLLTERVNAADKRLEKRKERPFSREELAVLLAAMLVEP